MLRSLKALRTTAVIVVFFMLCWLPYCILEGVDHLGLLKGMKMLDFPEMRQHIANKVLYLLVLFNSLGDPFIYALRMREVQRGKRLARLRSLSNTTGVQIVRRPT